MQELLGFLHCYEVSKPNKICIMPSCLPHGLVPTSKGSKKRIDRQSKFINTLIKKLHDLPLSNGSKKVQRKGCNEVFFRGYSYGNFPATLMAREFLDNNKDMKINICYKNLCSLPDFFYLFQ